MNCDNKIHVTLTYFLPHDFSLFLVHILPAFRFYSAFRLCIRSLLGIFESKSPPAFLSPQSNPSPSFQPPSSPDGFQAAFITPLTFCSVSGNAAGPGRLDFIHEGQYHESQICLEVLQVSFSIASILKVCRGRSKGSGFGPPFSSALTECSFTAAPIYNQPSRTEPG